MFVLKTVIGIVETKLLKARARKVFIVSHVKETGCTPSIRSFNPNLFYPGLQMFYTKQLGLCSPVQRLHQALLYPPLYP